MKSYKAVVTCPRCGKVLFKSRIIGGQEVNVEIQCHKCSGMLEVEQSNGIVCVKDVAILNYRANAA